MCCPLQLPGDGSHHPAPPQPPPASLREQPPSLPPALLTTGAQYSRLRVYRRDSPAQRAGKRAADPLHLPFPPRERRGSLGDLLGGLRPPRGDDAPRAGSAGIRDAEMGPRCGAVSDG